MNLVSLETFLAIVETGNLVRASQRMNVTQSTVTARLKAIEDELGQILLHRAKSGVRMTAAGAKFKRYAEAMVNLWRQAQQETRRPKGIDTLFNLGCEADLWTGLGRSIIDLLRREQPNTGLSAWPAPAHDLTEWLMSGLIDAAVSYRVAAREGQTMYRLCDEKIILVSTRPDAPMRFDPGYIFVDLGEDFGRRHAEAYADAGIAKISFGSTDWALDFLLEHGGSAYMPERLAIPLIAQGRLYPIDEAPTYSRTVKLIVSDAAAADWPWLPSLVDRIAADFARN